MEQVDHGDITVIERSSVVASEETNTSPTDVEEQLQLADGDAVLKCFSPLLNSMKVFGLYFTQTPRRIHNASTSTSGIIDSQVRRKWNGGRIYATIILIVVWLNTSRTFSIFHKADKFGAILLLKLSGISTQLFSTFLWTACFVSCQTGNLDRVFSEATLQKSDISKYRRWAVIYTIVCWVALLSEMSFLLPGLIIDNKALISLMAPFRVHVVASEQLIILAEVVTVILFIFTEHAWFFSHSVNYMVTSILCDQFRAMNKDFHRAIGCRGEFQGTIRDLRRRHQKLSQSVQNADQFMMISNVGGFCCQIVSVILILYCFIFFLNETVGQDVISTITYTVWLSAHLFSLTLTAYQGVVINHVVRVDFAVFID